MPLLNPGDTFPRLTITTTDNQTGPGDSVTGQKAAA
jgi:hypothetical protein